MRVKPRGARGKRDQYMELIERFPLRTIRDDAELDEATKIVNTLLDTDLDEWGTEYLEVLSNSIGDYEDKVHPIESPTDSEVLQHLLDARGVKMAEVSRETNIVDSTLSAIMHGNRRLTREQIGAIAGYFRVPPSVFSFPTD